MLHIIILLLKIIGMLLLLILALILLVLGIVLFSAITYKAAGSYDTKPDLSARIRWLFIVLRADMDYHDGRLDLTVRVFNKLIVDRHSGNEEIPMSEDVRADEKVMTSSKAYEDELSDVPGDSHAQTAAWPEIQPLPETKKTVDDERSAEACFETTAAAPVESETAETEIDSATAPGMSNATEKKSGSVERIILKIKKIIEKFMKKGQHRSSERAEIAGETVSKPSIGEKISEVIDHMIDKAESVSDKIDAKIENVERKIDSVAEKADFLDSLLQTAYVQETITFAGRMFSDIMGHILPKKLSGVIHYGTGDPASTGKILGFSSILYPLYGGSLKIDPDFSQSVIDGELEMKGRIRLGIFAKWIIKGLLNKNVKKSIKLGLRIKRTKSFKEDILWQ